MREYVCGFFALMGAMLSWGFGGWDAALAALTVCMAVDYISGSVVALVFHNSRKILKIRKYTKQSFIVT